MNPRKPVIFTKIKNLEKIANIFNDESPKKAIEELLKINKNVLTNDKDKVIAKFLYEKRGVLDKSKIGDYLGAKKNKRVLKEYLNNFNLKGDPVEVLREFLSGKEFLLPKEGQKITSIIDAFASAYVESNPNGFVKLAVDCAKRNGEDREYPETILFTAILMLNTSFSNKNIKLSNTMNAMQFKNMILDCGFKQYEQKLQSIFDNIKKKPMSLKLADKTPGIEYESKSFKGENFLQFSKQFANLKLDSSHIKNTFGFLPEGFKCSLNKPKKWISWLIGYKGTIDIKRKSGAPLVSIQYYKPNIFSRVFGGSKKRVIINPIGSNPSNLNYASKIAKALFRNSEQKISGGAYFSKEELEKAYDKSAISQKIKLK